MAAALRPAAGDAPLIQLSRVSKVYRRGVAEVRALDGLSLEVRDGEWVAVMGPSPLSMLLALLMALFVGVGFGLYPAWHAARLEPMDALRAE